MPSIDKTILKTAMLHDIGAHLDDQKEGAEREVYRVEGDIRTIKRFREAVHGLYARVDADVEMGMFDLENASKVKKYIERIESMCTGFLMKSEGEKIRQEGAVDAHRKVVEFMQKLHSDSEKELQLMRTEARLLAEKGVPPDEVGRPQSARVSIKEQRLAEEAPPAPPAPAAEPAPAKKRSRTRKGR